MIWGLIGFIVGFCTCYYGTKHILHRVVKGGSPLTASVMGASQYDDLLKFKKAVEAELEKRRWTDDS